MCPVHSGDSNLSELLEDSIEDKLLCCLGYGVFIFSFVSQFYPLVISNTRF